MCGAYIYIYIYVYIGAGGTRNGPYILPFKGAGTDHLVGVFAGHLLSGSPNASISSGSLLSWFWQFSEAFSQIVVKWFWDNCQSQCFRTLFALEMPKRCCFAICRSSCPKNAQKHSVFVSATLSFGCFHALRPSSQLG